MRLLLPLLSVGLVTSKMAVAQVQQHPEPAVALYQEVRHGVVQVISGISSGSGFIVEDDQLGRIIVTNAHVVDPGQDLSIILSDSLRIPATVIADDQRADIALLRANLDLCKRCPALRLAASTATRPPPGRQVYAVGYPLGLGPIFSAGVITGRSTRLLFSDVAINPGNSGGPLVDGEALVVGVNTFIRPSQTGPGISGIVDVKLLHELVASTRLLDAVISIPEVSADSTLPMLDYPQYPMNELLAAGDSVEFEQYEKFGDLDSRDFEISVFTPVSMMALAREQERQVSKRRRQREKEREVFRLNWYDERREFRQWHEDLGDVTQPYVVFRVFPKSGRTSGSIFSEILAGLAGAATAAATGSPYVLMGDQTDVYEFKGDLAETTFLRAHVQRHGVGGEPIHPIIGGTRPIRVLLNGQLVEFRDVAYEGVYVLSPEVFRPDSTGTPPYILMRFKDLTNDAEEDAHLYELPPEVVARIWNDFRPYYSNVLGEQAPLARQTDLDKVCRGYGSSCSGL